MTAESTSVPRRELLKSGVALAGAMCLPGCSLGTRAGQPLKDADPGFRHRGYLGWITDLAFEPEPGTAWPSMRLDNRLLGDYRRNFDLMADLGFNEISIWGLYVAGAWPVDIKSCMTPERDRLVRTLIDDAHHRKIKVLSGLGVYSWGFEKIIKANPRLARTGPLTMCASEPEAWTWMRKVVDFVFSQCPIDGVSMQSADQGRCQCSECKAWSDAEYHAVLNCRVGQYIRERWPGRVIGVNCWGLPLGDMAGFPSLRKTAEVADYIIDSRTSCHWENDDARRQLISSLKCDFGTLGGPQVEPPQHWARDRWFLPTLRRTGEHLTALRADGGRACEYYFHILANPGDEISMRLAGRILKMPEVPWDRHALSAVTEMFEVTRQGTADRLLQLLLRAEDAYFKHLPADICGTVSLEPLVGDRPGPPIYLTQRLTPAQRTAYAADLEALAPEFDQLVSEVRQPGKVRKIQACLRNVLADLRA
jgi:hypothetical protein